MKYFYLICCFVIGGCSSNQERDNDNEPDPNEPDLVTAILNSAEDETLHPEVSKFLSYEKQKVWHNNAYVYLWAINLKTDQVYETGLEIAQRMAALNQGHDYISDYDDSFIEQYPKITLPDSAALCFLHEKNCFANNVQNLNNKLKLANQYRLLRQRYNAFMSYPHYSDVSGWVMEDDSSHPVYYPLIAGMRIQHIFWLERLQGQHQKPVLEALSQEAHNLNRFLSQADNLVAKMVAVLMYSEHLELINAAFAMGWLKQNEIKTLTALHQLDAEALSTEQAWLNEERVKMNMIKKAYRADNSGDALMQVMFPDLLEKMIKPNTVLNKLYFDFVMPLVEYRNQNPAGFYHGLKNFDIKIVFDATENSGGTQLNLPAEEVKNQFLEYQARLFSLNMKIQLLKAITEQGTAEKVIETATQGHQPYLNHYDQSLPYLEDEKLCYTGIFENNKRYRCLQIIETEQLQ